MTVVQHDSSPSSSTDLRRAFVVGCRRSGTTWTMMLTAQHPEVVALQQTDVMRRLFHFTTWFETGHAFGRCALTRNREDENSTELQRTKLVEILDEDRLYELVKPLADEIFDRAAALNPEARLVVEQTPEHIHAVKRILRVYPDALFVHVLRDPRAVFASHRGAAKGWAKPRFFSSDPLDVSKEWCQEVTRGRAIKDLTDNYIEIRYESLKEKGPEELERLYSFLGLESDEALRQRALDACNIDRMRDADVAPKGFFRKGESQAWRTELSSSELRVIELLCGTEMQELGYPLTQRTPIPVPMRVKWRQFRENTKDRLRRTASDGTGVSSKALAGAARLSPALRRILADGPKTP